MPQILFIIPSYEGGIKLVDTDIIPTNLSSYIYIDEPITLHQTYDEYDTIWALPESKSKTNVVGYMNVYY